MKKLTEYIDGREAEMLAFLEKVVNIDSGTHDKAGVDAVGELLSGRLRQLGFQVERSPQTQYGDHLVARKLGKGSRRILFVGHMDTVFPAGTAARRPFRIEGGRAYGPGVLDMKGGDVSLLYALEALKETGSRFYGEVSMTVIFNSDEEVLSPTSKTIIEAEAKRADSACVFEPARPGGEYVARRKGVGKYYLTVHGRAAHAGAQPEAGRSAVGELAHKIIAIHGLTDFGTGTTLNVGLVKGGERSNVVAETAYAEIDLRVPDIGEAGKGGCPDAGDCRQQHGARHDRGVERWAGFSAHGGDPSLSEAARGRPGGRAATGARSEGDTDRRRFGRQPHLAAHTHGGRHGPERERDAQ